MKNTSSVFSFVPLICAVTFTLLSLLTFYVVGTLEAPITIWQSISRVLALVFLCILLFVTCTSYVFVSLSEFTFLLTQKEQMQQAVSSAPKSGSALVPGKKIVRTRQKRFGAWRDLADSENGNV